MRCRLKAGSASPLKVEIQVEGTGDTETACQRCQVTAEGATAGPGNGAAEVENRITSGPAAACDEPTLELLVE